MPLKDFQTTNRQHAVPQNIMDVEFKIIGDLTMRQFFYLAVFATITYISLTTFTNPIFRYPIAAVSLLIGLGFAFVPIEERGLDQWAVNFIKAVYAPTQRIWKKEPMLPKAFSFESISVVQQEIIALSPTLSRRKLEQYLNKAILQNEDPLDIPEKEYMKKIRGALAEATVTAPPMPPKLTVNLPEADTSIPPILPSQQLMPAEQSDTQESIQLLENNDSVPTQPETTNIDEVSMALTQKPQDIQIQVPEQKKLQLLLDRTSEFDQNYVPLTPLTPDMHSGRIFTSLLPNQGELVLPIRGEKVLNVQEEKLDQDVDEKLQKLNALMSKIRKEENIVKKELKETIEIKQESKKKPEQENKTQTLPEPATPVVEETLIQDTFHELPTETKETQEANIKVIPASPSAENVVTDKKPNIIHGVVKDASGMGIEDIILIIKNESNDPVRALKTNKIGAFSISTPLSNGYYIIETDKSKKTSLSFDIIKVEAVGQVLPPIEIVGR